MSVDEDYSVVVGAALGLPKSLARLAAFLLEVEHASAKTIEKALALCEGGARVYVGRLRLMLKEHKVSIHHNGEAYYINDNDLKVLSKMVTEFNH